MDLSVLSSEQLSGLAIIVLKTTEEKKRNKRRYWVHKMYQQRSTHGFFATTWPILKEDPEKFFKYTRMDANLFYSLLNLIRNRIEKFSIRTPLSPELRLLATIMYLAHGGPRLMYCSNFLIGETTFRKIIYETCTALWDELSKVYLSFPNDEEWKNISDKFYRKSNMPNCLAAIDGKHINIVCPRNSGSLFYDHKKRFSIVLLATCDSDHKFTHVEIGAYGSQSGIFNESILGQQLLNNTLQIPKEHLLANSNILFPYYLVGDAGFPLKNQLMRPYPGKNLDGKQIYFNQRLSSARISIENTFGIMAKRWQIVLNKINAAPGHVDIIVKAITVLHNYMMVSKNENYCPADFPDRVEAGILIEGGWRTGIIPLESTQSGSQYNRPTAEALNLRDVLANNLFENK